MDVIQLPKTDELKKKITSHLTSKECLFFDTTTSTYQVCVYGAKVEEVIFEGSLLKVQREVLKRHAETLQRDYMRLFG